ncbi:NAD(P)H-binding protein [Nocardia fusca]|uniref:NmrA family NAD(P)-binding protein n=1 Tax=Nocardia fusca TaxID=941183 RepID=UPI0037C97EC5
MTVLVTGASGTIGRPLLTRLSGEGVPVRAVVHRRDSATALSEQALPGVEVIATDLADAAATAELMDGVEAVFLATGNVDTQLAQEQSVIAAAAAAGVRRLVKVSVGGASEDAPLTLARVHYAAEQALAASGLTYTILRPAFFMDNLLQYIPWIEPSGLLRLPLGDGAVGMIDARDIADVAAYELHNPVSDNLDLSVTGPEDLTAAQALAAISEVVGRPLSYSDTTGEEFLRRYTSDGNPADYARDITLLYDTIVRAGYAAGTTDVVQQITGNPGRTIVDFAQHHRAAFTR